MIPLSSETLKVVDAPEVHDRLPTALVVEDEIVTRTKIVRTLIRGNFQVAECSTGEEALALLETRAFDLIILDLLLPGIDGFEVCKRIRASGKDRGVIMLTKLGDLKDVVRGLATGADDYIIKPFRPEELVARANAVLRREREMIINASMVKFRNLRIEFQTQKGYKDGQDLNLTPKEFVLLSQLCGNIGRPLSRAELVSHVWGENHHGSEKSLDVFIARLRRKVEDDPNAPSFIHTVRGFGYVCG